MASVADDEYSGANPYGPQQGRAAHVSVDAAYAFDEDWNATAWVSHEATDAEGTTVFQSNSQTNTFLGVSYYYKYW